MQSGERNPLERPRSVADIIGEALDIYQRYPLLFLALALGVIAPYELAVLAATGRGPLTSGGNVGVTYLLLLLDTAMVGPLVSALNIHAVVLVGQQRTPRLGEVVTRALRVLPVVAAAVIVSALGIALGFFALIIPGILLWLRWSVVAQVAAIEHEGWIPSLERSRELTRGRYLHVLGLLLIVGLLSAGISLTFAAIPLGSTAGAASVAVGIASRTLTASLSALALALLYFDLRARLAGARDGRLEPPVAAPPPQDGHEPPPELPVEPGEERP
jgi:hypothetical protein